MDVAWPPDPAWMAPVMPDGWDPVTDLSSPIINVMDNGRVAVLVAPFNVCIRDSHGEVDERNCFTAPRSPTNYHWAMTKPHPITREAFAWAGWGIDHAGIKIGLGSAIDHYANTKAATMALRYYDLDDGIYGFGSLALGMDDLDAELLSMMAMSGDWRRWAPDRRAKKWDMIGAQVVLNEAFRREDAVRRYMQSASASIDPGVDILSIELDVDPTVTPDIPQHLQERFMTINGGNYITTQTTTSLPTTSLPPIGARESLGLTPCSCGGHTVAEATPTTQFRREAMLDVHTAAVAAKSKLVSRPGETIMGLDKVTGDGRVILSRGYLAGMETFPLTINHDGTLQSIVGSVTNFRLETNAGVGDIELDLGSEFGELAMSVFEKGAGYSVELDSVVVEWWTAMYATTQGVDIGSTPPDAELQVVVQWRCRANSVVATPAFTDGIPEVDEAASVTPIALTADPDAEFIAGLVADYESPIPAL